MRRFCFLIHSIRIQSSQYFKSHFLFYFFLRINPSNHLNIILCCFLVIHLILPRSLAVRDLWSWYLLKAINSYPEFSVNSQFCPVATPSAPNTHLSFCLWAAPLSKDNHPPSCSNLQIGRWVLLSNSLSFNPSPSPAHSPPNYLSGSCILISSATTVTETLQEPPEWFSSGLDWTSWD